MKLIKKRRKKVKLLIIFKTDFLKRYEEKHNIVLEPEEEFELRMEWYQGKSEREANREWANFTEEDEILNRRSQSP